MDDNEMLLYWIEWRGRKSVQEIHDYLCSQSPEISGQDMASREFLFGEMVKMVRDLIGAIYLKKTTENEAWKAVREKYPWLTDKAFLKLWGHGTWCFDKG